MAEEVTNFSVSVGTETPEGFVMGTDAALVVLDCRAVVTGVADLGTERVLRLDSPPSRLD